MPTARWLLATFHLLALGIGLGAIVMRAAAFRSALTGTQLQRLFAADAAWGIAALLWISTGIARAFGGFEKGTEYYLSNGWFQIKMGCLLAILILEVRPVITVISWRIAQRRNALIDTGNAAVLGTISIVQAVLVVAMVFAATAMARGIGGM